MDLIKSYRRSLNSGIARAQEAATREADARGWDLEAVSGMMQEAEESTANLLPVPIRIRKNWWKRPE